MKILYSILIIWTLTNGIFISRLNLPRVINYWDEMLTIILFFNFLALLWNGKKIRDKTEKNLIFGVILILLIGISGNLVYNYAQSLEAIFRDIVGFIKFPFVYLIFNETSIHKKLYTSAGKLIRFLKIYSFIIFVFGILSMFINFGMTQTEYRYNFHPYMFLYGHPTDLVMAIVLIIVLMDVFEKGNKFSIYYILNFISLILTFRTKGIAIAALFMFLKLSKGGSKKFKILYWMGGGMVVFLVLWSKISIYMTFSSSGRQSLYSGAMLLARMCFPIGSGFATYASHVSGNYYSKVYDFIYIPEVNFFTNEFSRAILGDVGYPYYLGQFGLFGFVIMMKILFDQLKVSIGSIKRKNSFNLGMFIIVAYCFIGLTAESTLLNFGVELATVLSIARNSKSCSIYGRRSITALEV